MRTSVVIDTNVLVSAALKKVGAESNVLDLVALTVLHCFISAPIRAEYHDVLGRPRLKLQPQRRQDLLNMIDANATVVEPKYRLSVSPDETDNRFLECAEATKADFLITGNKRHFPAQWKTTTMLNAREFLARWQHA